ncbi:hypothetical protein [Paenibacillus periandrae]|uniref:hypothetical protein n=1 Tax=Paenibacillus periandrae TaxID=1761741 RepID=UPI001F089CE4|nr:hypothetical protein [Paenibacillus periandrae]
MILEAQIRLLTSEEGGMNRDGRSGMMPSFDVNGELIMCAVNLVDPDDTIKRGIVYVVTIQLPYAENYKNIIVPQYEFNLNYGGKIIGKGTVIKIT